jgi:hypothetical protein
MLSIFTDRAAPPFGRPLVLENDRHERVLWTGKRWYDPSASNGDLQSQEAWPPDPYVYGSGPWHAVISR